MTYLRSHLWRCLSFTKDFQPIMDMIRSFSHFFNQKYLSFLLRSSFFLNWLALKLRWMRTTAKNINQLKRARYLILADRPRHQLWIFNEAARFAHNNRSLSKHSLLDFERRHKYNLNLFLNSFAMRQNLLYRYARALCAHICVKYLPFLMLLTEILMCLSFHV